MSASSPVKKRLIEDLGLLPEDSLQEVLDFVGYLLSKRQRARVQQPAEMEQDPLLDYIAGSSSGSLAHDIDRDLYGE